MDIWKTTPEFFEFLKLLKSKKNVRISGLTDSALGSIIASVFNELKLNTVIVTEREKDIFKWSEIVGSFSSEKPLSFPADYPARQIEVIKKLITPLPRIIIACIESIDEKILPPEEFIENTSKIKTGDSSYDRVIDGLTKGNYIRCDVVSEPGEFARRGEVIDFWTPSASDPVRILFKLDKLSRIKTFDPVSQLSIETIDEAEIIPAEYPENVSSTLTDYLGKDFIVLSLDEETIPENPAPAPRNGAHLIRRVKLQKADMEFNSRTLQFSRSFSQIKNELQALKESSYRIIFSASNNIELTKLMNIVSEETGIKGEGIVSMLNEGFILENLKIAILSIGDILPSHRRICYKPTPPVHPVKEFSDLIPGDYIIHKKFGIGQFESIEKIEHNSMISDFLKLKYSLSGRLYVAVENSDLIQKYIGSKFSTKLDSLSGKSWKKTTYKVRESVRELSKKLVEIYKSLTREGISFKPYPEMEKEFADHFPYRLTTHQEIAIEEVLNDMESNNAMDRLVCGDVGYGKTEVAMRAAFRAVINGWQVVLLAPTTVLARQHFHTFRERFKNVPVIIEMLSRLVSNLEQKNIIERINDGKVDIVIGTHRLLSHELKFPSIGLIIIDEEQRFGVEQKEKLRFKSKNVEVLTLSATPIPRTLSMAFGKIKGLSLINTPPPGRTGIKTRVMPYELETVKDAIVHEVARGGQCYYIHSRISTISSITKLLQKSMPDISFKYIHGRIKPEEIDNIMADFIESKFDCLISTTLIENGLDIPNVNTMIIDYAQKLGLADIYQLRGRIGRSNIRAYCYLMYPGGLDLRDIVKERLSALSSFSAMGSGFQLALRDLQIRGAGELLGPEQHGNIMKVGFDYYTTILKEEIARLKGEEYIEPIEVKISLPVTAYIPHIYIDSAGLRLAFYRKLSSVTESNELSLIKKEMKDRFGTVPKELNTLFKIMNIKIHSAKANIESVAAYHSKITFKLVTGEKIETTITGNDILKEIQKEIKNFASKLPHLPNS